MLGNKQKTIEMIINDNVQHTIRILFLSVKGRNLNILLKWHLDPLLLIAILSLSCTASLQEIVCKL